MRLGMPGVLVATLLMGVAPAEARQARPAAESGPVEAVLDDGLWVTRILAPCREAQAAEAAADQAFAARLDPATASREERSMLQREALARQTARANARRGAVAHLTTLLFAFKARVATGGTATEPMGDVVEALLATSDPCAVDAVEGTLLAGLFGLPFTDTTARRLQAEGPFALADARFLELTAAGLSADDVFERLRPADDRQPLAYVAEVLRAAAASGADAGRASPVERDRRLRQVIEFLPLVFEPLRLRFYLHGKIDAVEGTFGLTLPELVDQHLFQLVEAKLFPTVQAMRRLRRAAPRDTLGTLAPVLDRWFRRTVLPGLARSLGRDPHAAYTFFVQSGGVVSPGPMRRYAVRVDTPAFSLELLRHARLDEALATVGRRRVPAAWVDAFTRLEDAAAGLTLSPAAVDAAIDRRPEPAAVRARLRRLLLSPDTGDDVSTLDVFRPLILDASRTGGRLDRALLGAAIDVVAGLKARAVARLVAADLESDGDPARAAYLRTAAALMLERERRQVTDGAFQQSTSGAAVGFLLRTLFMGGALPVSLAVAGGVTGSEFGELVDALTPKNTASGRSYHGRAVRRITLVHDGREYRDALVGVIDTARHFLNISAFDWKTDTGGRDIAYRLMAKKLGIDGAAYAAFVARFAAGLPLDDPDGMRVAFYDIPTARMKDVLLWHFFMTTTDPDVTAAREAALAAGASLACTAVRTCGALDGLGRDGSDTVAARRAWQLIESLFAAAPVASGAARPRLALRDYIEDPDGLRRFVRRTGLRRADRRDAPFPITIVADGKQNLFNIRWGERSEMFPYAVTEPIRDIYFMLAEFDIRVVLWKAPMEFPWNAGPVPWPGRRVAGRVPMPFVPWPWLASVPGFGWAGTTSSLALQWLLASDVRMWWASVNHTKSWSSESRALESGMGMASKYFNVHETHKTWHDMGVVVEGPVVGDVNDHFVQVFNQARVNNGGLAASRGTPIPRLRYEDFVGGEPTPVAAPVGTGGPSAADPGSPQAGIAGESAARAWLLTTHPENGDANYRGVFAAALAGARHNIYIENSFFSDPLVARMLMHKARELRARVTCEGFDPHACAARRRDAVQIYLVLPDSSDKPIVDAVGAADFFEMLNLGIKVHRWNPRAGWSASRMLHSKVWLVDYQPGRGGLAYVGAANATQRSHVSDNEAGILSNDEAFTREVYERIFVRDIAVDSRRETGENFRVLRASNAVVAGSRWLRRLLVELLWMI